MTTRSRNDGESEDDGISFEAFVFAGVLEVDVFDGESVVVVVVAASGDAVLGGIDLSVVQFQPE